jgi:16S rRNA (guanine966-N2)-methyltransferase
VRIISGSAKGRKLLAAKNMRVRPTADRVKEALFNILAGLVGEFGGIRVLDIFAGTGNLGLEALSRGAEWAVFVDNHHDSAAIIRKNLELLGFAGKAEIVVQEAVIALTRLEKRQEPFQLVFVDPPYRLGFTAKVLQQLATSGLIAAESIVVAEFSSAEDIPTTFGKLEEFDRRVYGDTALAFLSLADRG